MMKTRAKWMALLLAALLLGSLLSGTALAAEAESEEDSGVYGAYLYRQDDGMPKYWLDFTGATINNLVLHAYFRSSDPTFYESLFILDLETADMTDDRIEIHNVYDEYGFDQSYWYESFTILLQDDTAVMDIVRNEQTLAGGSEDNIFTGTYVMEPMTAGITYEYRQSDGMLKYWFDLTGDDLVLHGMFRSSDPDYYESTYVFGMEDAVWDDEYTTRINTVYNSTGLDVSDWFISLVLIDANGSILLDVVRDEDTIAGGGVEDNILTGMYLFEPRTYLLPLEEGPYTPEELGAMAQLYFFQQTGFYAPEAEVEEAEDGLFSVHLFENADPDGVSHTDASARYTVDENGAGTDDITGRAIDLARY